MPPSQPFFSRKAAVLLAAVVITLGVAAYLWTREGGKTDQGAPAADDEPETPERANLPAFRERARESGITFRMNFIPGEQGEKFKTNLYDHGCGVVIGDYNGDGHDDIYFLNQMGSNALYRNNGDGTFTDVTAEAGVALGDRICVGATFGDYLNEGRQSLFVTSTRGGNVLFHNRGDGTFEDVTKAAGLTHVGHSQTAVFFDYDGDGFLDLFVTNTAKWTLDVDKVDGRFFPGNLGLAEMSTCPIEYNILYHNNRDGTFSDVTEKAGLKGKGWSGDVAVFDYNDDGRPDLLVTNMFGRSQLYRNNGDGTFTDVSQDVLKRTSWGAAGCKVFDFNNDGLLDLYITDMHSDMWLPPNVDPNTQGGRMSFTKKYPRVTGARGERDDEQEKRFVDMFKIRYDEVLFGNTFFKKLPSGRFEEMSDKAGLETWWPWGIATGDFDNDGWEDVFVPSGMGYPYAYWPNALLMNNGNETFTDRASSLGIEPPRGGRFLKEKIGATDAPRSSRCAAVADFNGDGRLDLVVNNFNDRAFYFRNYFPPKNWVAYRLEGNGTKTNRDAIGALVRLHIGDEVMVRQVHSAGGYLSQSSKTLHFGLGERAKIDRAEVRWPGSTRWQPLDKTAINTRHVVPQPRE
ncbi:MAG TPA: CRTAC1 family protein [Gemmataceae bacterium]|nr:CRTAC1 family protein [Gemmataceae bacterium]